MKTSLSSKRQFGLGTGTFFLISILLITGCSTTKEGDTSATDSGLTSKSDPISGGDPSVSNAGVKRGQELFDTLGCMGCHKVNGQGGTVGPDLSNEGNKGRANVWLNNQIRNPRKNDPKTVMPAYDYLSDKKVTDLVSYLQSLSTGNSQGDNSSPLPAERKRMVQTAAGIDSTSLAADEKMWAQQCGQCHNLRPPSEYSDAQWAVVVFHMRVRVPLTGEEQQKILEFLKASN